MQHNFDIPNQQGAEYRADVNRALQALATLSSGPVAPAAPYPHMWWMDTSSTPPVLRRRSADNTFWQVVDPGTVNSYFKRNADGDVVALSPEELAEELTTAGRLLKVGDFGIGSSEELAYWRDRAALLDPAAYRFYNGVDDGANWSFTVPAGETWYALELWQVVTPSDNTRLFLRVADVFRPLPLPAGTTIQAAQAGAHAYICRPALVVDSDPRYNNPRVLYFNRLARLRTLTLHQQTIQVPPGSSMGSNFTTDFPTDFDNGFVVGVTAHDVSWVTMHGVDSMNTQNEVSDEHQIRFAEAVNFPFRRAIFSQIRTSAANISGDLSGSSLQGYGAVFYYKLPADW